MKKFTLPFLMAIMLCTSCKKENKKALTAFTETIIEKTSKTKISPISHATAVISFKDVVIYLDPTGGAKAFANFKNPNYVLITDVHGDHMNLNTLKELDLTKTTIIAPKAVAKNILALQTKEIISIDNGETKNFNNFSVEAIPMYNLREEALKIHSKGRGNGYVLTIDGERIYFSGDTEDIPEMRNLKNIDKAFVCMNLPYTMTVESAADAVLAFAPKKVYPYHYRGTNGFSDVEKFKKTVNELNKSIDVIQWNWYPNKKS